MEWSWTNLTLVIGAGLLIWLLYYRLKDDKKSFSKENLSKSFHSMGVLALILIVFVSFCVYILTLD